MGIIEVVLPSLCRYEADAEVELYVEARAQSVSSLSGELFDFIFPKIGRTYYGHWDDKDFLMDSDRKRRTGNAFLCFHNLTLSQKNPSPGGRPLSRCDEFIIMKRDVLVGRGGVTRVLPTTPVIGIRHPTITGQLKTETSFV